MEHPNRLDLSVSIFLINIENLFFTPLGCPIIPIG